MDFKEFQQIVTLKVKTEEDYLLQIFLELLPQINPEDYLKVALSLNACRYSVCLAEFMEILNDCIYARNLKVAKNAFIKNFEGSRLQEEEMIASILTEKEHENFPKWIKEI